MEAKTSVASEALQRITEQIFANMKQATPVMEELLKAAQKYKIAMDAANQAATVFVGALEKVASTACQSRGSTGIIGKSFQDMATLHQDFVSEQEEQAIKLTQQFIQPLQKRLKGEGKSLPKLEDDFKSMSKSYKSDLKRAGLKSFKAQKVASKKNSEKTAKEVHDSMKSMLGKSKRFEAFNQRCLRAALIEERRRYSYLVDNYISVFEPDFIYHSQRDLVREAVGLIQDPEELPQSSLDVIEQSSSNGIMFQVSGEEDKGGIVPSPLTQEFQRRMSAHSGILPPGCPRGGLQGFQPTEDQMNPISRQYLEENG
eukprot:m.18310 g.18310  ORF g.18310 m.18310 type:complete len:314 (+) comp4945_c0_seq2:47-988(+)